MDRAGAVVLFVVSSLFFVSGCVSLWSSLTPLKAKTYHDNSSANPSMLVVLLPGIRDDPSDFARNGFIAALRERGMIADIVAVDAHYGYYIQQNIVQRIREDIVLPAKALGYRDIWLIGISLGGFGALQYASAHPKDISGLLVIAPYLGRDSLIRQITAAGGVTQWTAPDPASLSLPDSRVWRWLQQYSQRATTLPTVCLGYGRDDGFAGANALLADILEPRMVSVTDGGHDWSTWKRLWREALRNGGCLDTRIAGTRLAR